ncbi:MAG: DUF523 domain-containing protein [Anaerovoracaceae bacterium]|jgi:uncharacterized protein YbbK (DUF523 family)
MKRRRLLVSACLCGEPVRYDGRARALDDPRFQRWLEEGRLVPICPEVAGGLPVPRPEAQRRGSRVVTRDGRDVTTAYERGAAAALALARSCDAALCILKQSSPSCGSLQIHDGSFRGKKIPGRGFTAEVLQRAGFRVFGEDQMDEIERAVAALDTTGDE